MTNKDELMAKANKPAEEAMRLHPFYRGKVEVALKSPVRDVDDFSIWYTPRCGCALQGYCRKQG